MKYPIRKSIRLYSVTAALALPLFIAIASGTFESTTRQTPAPNTDGSTCTCGSLQVTFGSTVPGDALFLGVKPMQTVLRGQSLYP